MAVRRTDFEPWPELSYVEWRDTAATLHRWTQIVGKVRLAHAPAVNHWWHAPLYVTARGLTTSPIPYGERTFELLFDFVAHELRLSCSDGAVGTVTLEPKSVARFYAEVMSALASLGLSTHIWTTPSELPGGVPFDEDEEHASYDPEYAARFFWALVSADRVLKTFRSGYLGKVSPVHFFWGSFDLAVTRFSGRPAPPHPGAPILPDWVMREAYSHELSSAGFWPGGEGFERPVFYAYAYPEPTGFREAAVGAPARFEPDLGEYVLEYEAVRKAADPDRLLLSFLRTTYTAAADLGRWNRAVLER